MARKTKRNNLQNPKYRIISLEKPNSYATEAYRRIKIVLDAMSMDNPSQVIHICSATPGDGKTTTLLNIAISYAESGKKVLLIDLDLRKPKLHRAFRSENLDGFSDYLTGEVKELSAIINHCNYDNVDFICAGVARVHPTSLLSMERTRKTIEALREQYDVILVDEPPVLAAADCCIISKFCDGALFQISQKNTEKSAAKEAVRLLRQNGVNILGCVFSEVSENSRSYSYDYYR